MWSKGQASQALPELNNQSSKLKHQTLTSDPYEKSQYENVRKHTTQKQATLVYIWDEPGSVVATAALFASCGGAIGHIGGKRYNMGTQYYDIPDTFARQKVAIWA